MQLPVLKAGTEAEIETAFALSAGEHIKAKPRPRRSRFVDVDAGPVRDSHDPGVTMR